MKQIAVLKYTIIFDPSETWTNGYQFEKDLADFFAAHGKEAQIVQSAGGTGERVIWISPLVAPIAQRIPQPRETKSANEQIKQVQQQTPQKGYKTYQDRGVPKSFVNQEKRQPKPTFGKLGRSNRQKVRVP